MNAERTEEQKLRDSQAPCFGCNTLLIVGPNYPPGVPIPNTVELWCGRCGIISHYVVDRKPSQYA